MKLRWREVPASAGGRMHLLYDFDAQDPNRCLARVLQAVGRGWHVQMRAGKLWAEVRGTPRGPYRVPGIRTWPSSLGAKEEAERLVRAQAEAYPLR